MIIYLKNRTFAKMKKRPAKKIEFKPNSLKRENKITFSLNDKELNMMRQYLENNKIENQSRWIREVVMGYLWQKAEDNYPSLFNEAEIRK